MEPEKHHSSRLANGLYKTLLDKPVLTSNLPGTERMGASDKETVHKVIEDHVQSRRIQSLVDAGAMLTMLKSACSAAMSLWHNHGERVSFFFPVYVLVPGVV